MAMPNLTHMAQMYSKQLHNSFPMYKYSSFHPNVLKKVQKFQNKAIHGEPHVQFGAMGVVMPKYFSSLEFEITEFEVQNGDVFIAGFPKSGINWVKEMVWLLTHNLDYDEARSTQSYRRTVYFERTAWPPEVYNKLGAPSHSSITKRISSLNIEPPRVFHTHLHWDYLPQALVGGTIQAKIIYVLRNPKEVCVSLYHHRVLLEGYLGSMDNHVDEFVSDMVVHAPYWEHVEGYRRNEKRGDILIISFEEMKQDLESVINKVSTFLCGSTILKVEAKKLIEHLTFENMKLNPMVNLDDVADAFVDIHGVPRKTDFFRKGKIDSWTEELSEDSKKRLDEWIQRYQ